MLPYYWRYPNVKAGANFLKSLQEMPQFVCTCCHLILFHKTVKPFKIGEYDMNNDIAQKCLSYCYRMTLQKSVYGEAHVNTVNDVWPTVEDRIWETHNVYTMSEFICIWCRNSLWQKKPNVPDQACANGLKLHDIPQELDSITPLECRLIAKHIPFLTILLMKTYGEHYQFNGPCVNIPPQLDQVLKILPQMSSELQLHPLKVKHKLEYKNHYIYYVFQKDRVIGAITWLKQHSPHYTDIIPNHEWYSSITNSELATCVHEDEVRTSRRKWIGSYKHDHTDSWSWFGQWSEYTWTIEYRWYFKHWRKQSCCFIERKKGVKEGKPQPGRWVHMLFTEVKDFSRDNGGHYMRLRPLYNFIPLAIRTQSPCRIDELQKL